MSRVLGAVVDGRDSGVRNGRSNLNLDLDLGKQLPKLRLKHRENPVDDALTYLQEREEDRPFPHRSRLGSPVEHYLRGDVGLHLHASLKVELAPEPTDYCVLLHATEDRLDSGEPMNTGANQPDLRTKTDGGGDVDEPVLVDVRQLLKSPQGSEWRVLPSVIRLKPLNSCPRRAGHSFDLVESGTGTMPSELRTSGIDGKGRGRSQLLRQRSRVGVRQGVSKLVERRSIVENAIPDEDAQLGRRIMDILDAGNQPPFLVKFANGRVEVRPAEAIDHLFDSFQMFLGPIELE